MLESFFILGERCSGTNYLHNLIESNFDLTYREYHHKHFFGFDDYPDSDSTLFLGVIRSPVDWLASLIRTPHHLVDSKNRLLGKNVSFGDFSQLRIKSVHCYPEDDKRYPDLRYGDELVKDRNMDAGSYYRDIFELRKTKNNFLQNKMPKKVKHYYLVIYDQLKRNPVEILRELEQRFQLRKRGKSLQDYKFYKETKKVYKPIVYTNINPNDYRVIRAKLDLEQEGDLGFTLKEKIALIYEPNVCHGELLPFWIQNLVENYHFFIAFNTYLKTSDFIVKQFPEYEQAISNIPKDGAGRFSYDLVILNSIYDYNTREYLDISKFMGEKKLACYHNTKFKPILDKYNNEDLTLINLHPHPISNTFQLTPIFNFINRATSICLMPNAKIRLFTITNSRSDVDLLKKTVNIINQSPKFELFIINNCPTDKEIPRGSNIKVFKGMSEGDKYDLVSSSHFILCFQNNDDYLHFQITGLYPLSLITIKPMILTGQMGKAFKLPVYIDINQFPESILEITQNEYKQMISTIRTHKYRLIKANGRYFSKL